MRSVYVCSLKTLYVYVCYMGLLFATQTIYAGDVLSGTGNSARGTDAVVAGGEDNEAGENLSFVGGGAGNGSYGSGGGSFVGAGEDNWTSGAFSFIGCGAANRASGAGSFVGAGGGNEASGLYSFVGAGEENTASGDYSFAGGRQAKATRIGCFVWGDSTASDITSSASDQFLVRASGGVRFYSNAGASTGVRLAPGSGSWASMSDRNAKENVQPIDGQEVLHALIKIPMATWNYKTQDEEIRHMGPMAQDFHAAFGVGEDEKTISNVDADGVALAAIQGLHQLLKEKDAEIASLRDEVNVRLANIEKQIQQQSK